MSDELTPLHALVLGRVASINALVAAALAYSLRDHEDPRGTLSDLVEGLEGDLSDTIGKFAVMLPGDFKEQAVDAGQSNTLKVGRIADALLEALGAGPAKR
ncbi:hypothetical protein [Luteimonas sp. A478]